MKKQKDAKKKILVFGYHRCNLGDDLFIYIVSKRYPNMEFYLYVHDEDDRRPFKSLKNVKIIPDYRNTDSINPDDYDGYTYIGGSVFIESEYSTREAKEISELLDKLKKANKPFFYITCNFGPCKTKKYKETIKNNLKKCTDVCFRGKSSYNEFKDLDTVRFAPDIVFSHDYSNLASKKEKKTAGITVINIENREALRDKADIYYDYIKRIVCMFAKRGYKISLISFCKHEGDEQAIEKVKGMIPEEYANNVDLLIYSGDVEKFLREYSKIEYMVCTRFHAMILSLIFRQKIYNLIYSDKSKEPLEDFNIRLKTDEIKDISYETVLRTFYFRKICNFKLSKLKKESQKQFEAFEEYYKE